MFSPTAGMDATDVVSLKAQCRAAARKAAHLPSRNRPTAWRRNKFGRSQEGRRGYWMASPGVMVAGDIGYTWN
ncbi:hypothetical protein [Mycobacterium arosiense]|uniref:hypothetical protein n=1 Tax=Mycobacterium arosiense TaxID=425468 RepID=UPI00114FCD64|nr:hypothetical protein [Mycobacterium arosiense]